MWVCDRLDGLWGDEDFADWYPRDGRLGLSPAQLATVSLLQFLPDRADQLLDLALARLKDAGLVRERTTQRTDSTHVLAAVRDLTRL